MSTPPNGLNVSIHTRPRILSTNISRRTSPISVGFTVSPPSLKMEAAATNVSARRDFGDCASKRTQWQVWQTPPNHARWTKRVHRCWKTLEKSLEREKKWCGWSGMRIFIFFHKIYFEDELLQKFRKSEISGSTRSIASKLKTWSPNQFCIDFPIVNLLRFHENPCK